jgi:large subunit ribosomal protein L15e
MGLYKYIRDAWANHEISDPMLQTKRLSEWRTQPVTFRIERPTRLDRARSLGYKAKPGFIIVRQRVDRGGRMRARIRKGRRTAHMRHKLIIKQNYQQVAEQRAGKAFTNCEVLNSYEVGKDGTHYWYEIILVDTSHPVIKADKNIAWITNPANRNRVTRGLTSAGKRGRGMMHKGKGAEKVRPSLRANSGRAN